MTQPITQGQRLDFLIRCLLNENEEYKNREIPAGQRDKRRLLRSLMNVRPPVPASIMAGQMKEEATGKAKITKAYNLPCRYVLHTVGPIIYGTVTKTDCELLAGCYRSCLELAAAYGLKSVAFCCISTGEFHFPNELAAEIAIQTVRTWQQQNSNRIEVIFNVFKDSDYEIYKRLL